MKNLVLLIALCGTWTLAYSDWLSPGWLTFGVPASWRSPRTTITTYNVGCQTQHTLRRGATQAIKAPLWGWVDEWHRRLNSFGVALEASQGDALQSCIFPRQEAE